MAEAEALLARASLWQWAARAFWYPEGAYLADLRDRTIWRELADLAALVDAVVATALARFRRAARLRPGAGPDLPEEHTFLFARQVPVSPHGTAYAPALGADRAQELAKIGSFYAAFGFQVSDARRELPDHVCLELEFVAALLIKEAYALTQGWAERAALTRAARGRFLEEHLGRWLPLFAGRLEQHARLAFYPGAAELALALLAPDTAADMAGGDPSA